MNYAIKEQVQELIKQKQKIDQAVELIKALLTNKRYDIMERWDLYLTLVEYGLISEIETCGDGHIDILDDNLTMYDSFYVDRHQTFHYTDMWDSILEDEYGTTQSRDEWREKVLEDGNAGFVHDW